MGCELDPVMDISYFHLGIGTNIKYYWIFQCYFDKNKHLPIHDPLRLASNGESEFTIYTDFEVRTEDIMGVTNCRFFLLMLSIK